jgi:hypothetical protein
VIPQNVPRELLRYSATTLHNSFGLDICFDGSRNAFRIDTSMTIESSVFYRDQEACEVPRHIIRTANGISLSI